ncbi:MAG: phage tail tape measure protein [Dehalococcoidia bacterium]
MATRNARVILTAQDRASRKILRVSGALKGLGALAVMVGAVQIGRKMVRGITEGVKVFADWDAKLSGTAAVLGKNRGEMMALEKQSKLLGRTTQFTARQVAEAQFTFAKAGFDVQKIYSTIPGTMNLAAAAEISVGEAADITAKLLAGFNLEASAAADVADLLALTANSANTTITELAEGFKFAVPASKSLGVGITEMNAAMAVLSDRALGGSIGGTGLAKTFTTLLGSINKVEGAIGLDGGLREQLFKVGADGKSTFIGLVPALKLLQENGVNAGNVYKIFGERAGKVADTLLRNIDALEAMTTALGKRKGVAKAVAEAKLDNFKGDVTKLKSAFEGLQLTVGEKLNEGLRILAQQLTLVVQMFTESTEGGNTFASLLEFLASLLANLVNAFLFVGKWANIIWTGIVVGVRELVAIMIEVFATIVDQVTGLMRALNFGGIFDDAIESVNNFAKANWDAAESVRDGSADMIRNTMATSAAIDETRAQFDAVAEAVRAAADETERLAEAAASGEQVEEDAQTSADVDQEGTDLGPTTDEIEEQQKAAAAIRLSVKEQTLAHERELEKQAFQIRMQDLIVQQEEEAAFGDQGAQAKFELAQLHAQERLEMEREFALMTTGPEALAEDLILMEERHLMEMEALEENELEKTELLQLHLLERKILEDQHNAAKLKAIRTLAAAENKAMRGQHKFQKKSNKQAVGEGLQLMQQFAGKSKTVAIGLALIDTFRGMARAFNDYMFPASAIIAALVGAAGLAQVANIRKQKFAHGGQVQGMGGIDSVSAGLTPGELVADTTAQEGRDILGGRASIVPAGGGGGGNTIIIEGDVIDPEEFFRRNSQGIGLALEQLQADGGTI